jgi:hypothetical protein
MVVYIVVRASSLAGVRETGRQGVSGILCLLIYILNYSALKQSSYLSNMLSSNHPVFSVAIL